MSDAGDDKKRPNRVFQAMILISLGLHFVIFLYIADLYHSENYRYIEVSVAEENELERRAIPQPRFPHNPPKVENVDKIDVNKQKVPQMKPAPVEDASSPDIAMNEIGMPDTSGLAADISDSQPPTGAGQYLTKGEYFDMLRLKIESKKQYPKSAQKRQAEGRVVVGFTLAPNGEIDTVKVVESSQHPALDRAALQAVKKAGPLPRPPSFLFDGPLELTITIQFELT